MMTVAEQLDLSYGGQTNRLYVSRGLPGTLLLALEYQSQPREVRTATWQRCAP